MQILSRPSKKPYKTIQKGVSVIPSGQTSLSVLIANVDYFKAVVVIREGSDQNPSISTCKASAYVSDNTHIHISTHNAVQGATTETVYWEVIEFNGIKTVQKGLNAYSVHSNNLTVSSVDASKCLLFGTHKTDGAQQVDGIFGYGLTSNTNIAIKKGGSGNATLNWSLVEFK